MGEFFQSYGFFVLIAVLMLVCHGRHASHGSHREDGTDDQSDGRPRPGRHER